MEGRPGCGPSYPPNARGLCATPTTKTAPGASEWSERRHSPRQGSWLSYALAATSSAHPHICHVTFPRRHPRESDGAQPSVPKSVSGARIGAAAISICIRASATWTRLIGAARLFGLVAFDADAIQFRSDLGEALVVAGALVGETHLSMSPLIFDALSCTVCCARRPCGGCSPVRGDRSEPAADSPGRLDPPLLLGPAPANVCLAPRSLRSAEVRQLTRWKGDHDEAPPVRECCTGRVNVPAHRRLGPHPVRRPVRYRGDRLNHDIDAVHPGRCRRRRRAGSAVRQEELTMFA